LACDNGALSLIEVITAKILIELSALQQVIGNDQDRVSHSYYGSLFATSVCEPPRESTQVRIFGAHSSLSGFNECLTQPAISFARGATYLFAGTLMVAWTVG